LQHTRDQLFRPFRFGQWSRLALVGILAAELHVGGCGAGNIGNWSHVPRKMDGRFSLPGMVTDIFPFDPSQIRAGISEHIAQFLGLILVGVFLFVILTFIFLYINSVFRFILFDSVVQRKCSISEGWQKWRRAGGRYFLWKIVFQISVWLFFLFLVGVPLAIALAAGWANDIRQHVGRLIVGVVLFVGLVLVCAVATIVVQVLAKDFLVPIMALEDLDFADGWYRLLAMIRAEKGPFTVYLLLKIVLSIAATIIFTILAFFPAVLIILPSVIVVIAATAAGAGWNVATISLAIIFGTVALAVLIYLIALVSVPATVFFPAYAIYFLAPRYPILDAILHPVLVSPSPELPPLPQSAPPFEMPPLPPAGEPIS
jgi:4-amino-4-deoxy-L-arabinose transferase-like glycosyltransferase